MNFRWFFSVKPFWWKSDSFLCFLSDFTICGISPLSIIIAREDAKANVLARAYVLILLRLLILLGENRVKKSAVYAGSEICYLHTPPHLPAHSPPFTCLLPPFFSARFFLLFSWYFRLILSFSVVWRKFLLDFRAAFFGGSERRNEGRENRQIWQNDIDML